MNPLGIRPMLATGGPPPIRYGAFAVEAKYDGQRGIAILQGGEVTLLSRNGAVITRTFPEVTSALPAAVGGRPVVLDGEIVAPDRDGVPCFGRLQRRWPQNRRPSAELLRECPVQLFAFDVLALDGHDVTQRPYVERRALLDDLRANSRNRVIRFPANYTDTDPAVVLAAAADMRLEGIVTKRLDSTYVPGERTRDWIKTPLRQRSEFVVGGWLPGQGPNRHTVGAVLVGAHSPDGQLRFCGVVSAGMTAHHRRVLVDQLTPMRRATPAFDGLARDFLGGHVRWVTPELVGDVEYRELRGTLRHASWKGLRADTSGSVAVMLPAS